MFLNRIFNQKAALLVEVLLTVSILSVGLVYIVRSYVSSLRASKRSQEYSLAALLLKNTATDFLKKGFIGHDFMEKGSFQEPHDHFSYEVTTRKAELQRSSENLNEVYLSVFWPSGRQQLEISGKFFLFDSAERF